MQEFGYLKGGQTNICTEDSDMMMTINVHALEAGSTLKMRPRESEVAVVLIQGHVQMNGHNARRDSCIDDPGYCLHLCRDSVVEIKAEADSEILIQTTPNPRAFPGLIYNPANTRRETFGQGQFEGKALRTVTTFFDYETAPYSNMVCGEILIPQGGWSSYPPHEHPQPEVYYYRFGHPAGFGACFIDDNAYVIKDRSFAAIPGGKYHPQVNAPGYPMMYVWMIRHFEGYPWTERNFQPEHQWLLEE